MWNFTSSMLLTKTDLKIEAGAITRFQPRSNCFLFHSKMKNSTVSNTQKEIA